MEIIDNKKIDEITDTVAGELNDLDNYSEDELHKHLGKKLFEGNYTLASEDSASLLTHTGENQPGVNSVEKAFNRVKNNDSADPDIGLQKGKGFFGRVGEEALEFICTNPKIRSWIQDTDPNVKRRAIRKIVKLIASTIGLAFNPVLATIIVILILLIFKIGYPALCQPIWDAENS